MLSPIRFAHSSTSLTVPERSRREGKLFACHSEPIRFAQGKLREGSRCEELTELNYQGEILRRPDGMNRDSSE